MRLATLPMQRLSHHWMQHFHQLSSRQTHTYNGPYISTLHATPTVCFQTLKRHMVFCTGPIHDRRNSNQARAWSLTEDKGVILPLKGISLLCQSFIMLCLTLLLIHLAVSMSSSSPDRSSSCVHDQSKFPMLDPHQTPPRASKEPAVQTKFPMFDPHQTPPHALPAKR